MKEVDELAIQFPGRRAFQTERMASANEVNWKHAGSAGETARRALWLERSEEGTDEEGEVTETSACRALYVSIKTSVGNGELLDFGAHQHFSPLPYL